MSEQLLVVHNASKHFKGLKAAGETVLWDRHAARREENA